MQMSVLADTKQLTKHLNRIQKKQIPFATSKALNDVAFDSRSFIQKSLPRRLDRPTKGIISSVQVEKSKKKNLVARVGFAGLGFKSTKWSESPAEIMRRHIKGGTRSPKQLPHLRIPSDTKGGGLKLNKFGNIAGKKGKLQKMLGNKDQFFSGIPKGDYSMKDAGIWERTPRNSKRKSNKKHQASGKIVQRIAYEPSTRYKSIFPFKKIVDLAIKKNYRKRFDAALNKALSTAR
jgi:hypothetical protein